MKAVVILLILLIVLAVLFSGCTSQNQPQSNVLVMTQEQANQSSELLAGVFDQLIPDKDVQSLATCEAIDGAWCSQGEKQKWLDDCRKEKIPEECITLGNNYFKNWLAAFKQLSKEKETKKQIALRIKETKSYSDLLEVVSSIIRIGEEIKGVVKGSENEFGYNAVVVDGAPFNGLQDQNQAIAYFKKTRADFQSAKIIVISDEKVWSNINGADTPAKTFLFGILLNTISESQKTELLQKSRAGYDGFRATCNQEAAKFDAAESKSDFYQMAYSAGYLVQCIEFLNKFK